MKVYNSLNHSKFTLKYHLIFVCKYRKMLLIKYGDEIKQIMKDISYKCDFTILVMEVDKDHIHLLIESVPKVSPLMIVRVLKQQSTQVIYGRHFKELKKQFWKENTFWTDGYFCSTIGEVSEETLKKYIKNQG
ncbi:MAG: IS200/IS605 family transposase [Oscillospiraceae bacterium]